jgi:glycosyltransferase involved in cell wall biosynthesis
MDALPDIRLPDIRLPDTRVPDTRVPDTRVPGTGPGARSIALIGNSLPRRCGIATFTTDLQQAIAGSWPGVETWIVAMTDQGRAYDYPAAVQFQVRDDCLDDYHEAAAFLNDGGFDVVSLQHEFGIFGGAAGDHIVALLDRLEMPVVTTLHTVLSEPTMAQRSAIDRVIDASSRIIVMADKARTLLRGVYQVPLDKIGVIPHGIPDVPFTEPDAAKVQLGFGGRPVILTFGLLSPNKGIEVMIDAMPAILRRCRNAIYVVLGATHPNLVRHHGEAYRESLLARVRELGIEEHVVFLDQFVDQKTLLGFIAMCDVYVTPYLNEAQMTSGTLAYSFGMGKAVVSTPYWHARELLADGRGVLVPFGDSSAIAGAVAGLLTDDARRQGMRVRAYASSRTMTWRRTAERYMAAFEGAPHGQGLRLVGRSRRRLAAPHNGAPPAMQVGHLMAMCDDTGLFQHAIHSVPDRLHGYCVDDNARALLLACTLNRPGEQTLSEVVTARFAAFVQHAWNPDTRRFRNFMSFDRRWLEDRGSEDSHARTLWALGECARRDADPSRRGWAASLFAEALPTALAFGSPRSWAFTLLGLDAYCAARPDDGLAAAARPRLAARLLALLAAVETSDWVWFEEGLSYDNARLPQALIVTGAATGAPETIEAGLRALRWLIARQTSPSGQFRPVGTDGFSTVRTPPQAFDQQPLEATATIAACLAAWHADGDPAWRTDALSAFAWFLGANDLSVSLVDPETGSCRDGLHPDRANENRGGESVLSYLLGLADVRQVWRGNEDRPPTVSLRAVHA